MNSLEHPTHNRRLGAPPGMQDSCRAMSVRDDVLAGAPVVVSHWRPTPDELRALNAGAVIALAVVGRTMPPVAMWLESPE